MKSNLAREPIYEKNIIEPIVRLWLLRLLIQLGAHKKLISKYDFENVREFKFEVQRLT